MDSITPAQVYEDFVPPTKQVQEEHFDILHLTLPELQEGTDECSTDQNRNSEDQRTTANWSE
ncbi:hypothetical protein P3S68_001542 [Capsicum galapagoense]